jgi:hypothetical protein
MNQRRGVPVLMKPAQTSPVATSMGRAVMSSAEGWAEVSGLQGSLAQLQTADLVQMLAQGGRTAVIMLRNRTTRGLIALHNGAVVAAELDGELSGFDAFSEMAFWSEGLFRVRYRPYEGSFNIAMDTTLLILESARCRDEQERANATTAIPQMCATEAALAASATREPTQAPLPALLRVEVDVLGDEIEHTPPRARPRVPSAAPVPMPISMHDLPTLLPDMEVQGMTPSGVFQRFFEEAGQRVVAMPSIPFSSAAVNIESALDQEIDDILDGNRTSRERPRRSQANL